MLQRYMDLTRMEMRIRLVRSKMHGAGQWRYGQRWSGGISLNISRNGPKGCPMTSSNAFIRTAFSRLTDVLNLDAMKEILELFEKNEVSLVNKIVLGTTFDHVVVKREDMPRLMEAFRAFEGNTSLKEQADIIQAMHESGKWVAVVWNQTSVNADTWDQFDYAQDKAEPYNLNRFDKHWFLFDGIKDTDNN